MSLSIFIFNWRLTAHLDYHTRFVQTDKYFEHIQNIQQWSTHWSAVNQYALTANRNQYVKKTKYDDKAILIKAVVNLSIVLTIIAPLNKTKSITIVSLSKNFAQLKKKL